MISTPPIPARLVNIQALRAFAALIVLISHWTGIEANHSLDRLFPNLTVFGMFGVDLFFVISGFILFWIAHDLKSNGATVAQFLYARFSRIYPLYWALTAAVACLLLIKPDATAYDPSQGHWIRTIFLWPDSELPLLKVAWTLIHELYFYLIFGLILFLPERLRLWALCLWAAGVVIGNGLGLGQLSPELRLVFNPLGLEFFGGVLCAVALRRKRPAFGGIMFFLGLALWGAGLALFTLYSATALPTDWQRVGLFGLPALCLVYGAVAMEINGKLFSRGFKVLGDWSYSLYLSHVLSLTALGYIWQNFARTGWVDNIIVLPIMSLIAIAISGLIYTLYERPVLSLTKAIGRKLFIKKAAD